MKHGVGITGVPATVVMGKAWTPSSFLDALADKIEGSRNFLMADHRCCAVAHAVSLLADPGLEKVYFSADRPCGSSWGLKFWPALEAATGIDRGVWQTIYTMTKATRGEMVERIRQRALSLEV